MTGSGKTGPRHRADRGGAAAGRAGAADRPQGRPHQPLPDVPRPRARRLRAVGQRGRRRRRPGSPSDDFAAAAGRRRGPKGLAGWGIGADRHRRAARAASTFTIYTPGSQRGRAAEHRRLAAGAGRRRRRRDRRRRDRGLRHRPARPRRHRRRPAVEPRAHPAVQPDPQRVDGRARPRPADARRHGAAAADPQARRVRARRSSSRRRIARRSRCGSTACSPRRRSRRGAAGRRSTSTSMLRTPDGKPRCAIVTTAHLSDEERQFVTTLVLSKLVTWMRRQSGTTDLRALLYMDEVAGYLPPTADAADQEADHDADEAGPGVRRRRRAGHAEPGRRRLQGAVQRRHVDDRPAADRARQAAPARRHERRRGGVDVGRGRRHDLRARPSASSCCAGPARTSPRCSPPAGR